MMEEIIAEMKVDERTFSSSVTKPREKVELCQSISHHIHQINTTKSFVMSMVLQAKKKMEKKVPAEFWMLRNTTCSALRSRHPEN